MKKLIIAMLLILCTAGSGWGFLITATGSGLNAGLSASANFEQIGGNLVVTLTNTSTSDVTNPSQVLTALLFSYNGPTLNTVSAMLANGSTVFYGPSNGGNVGGEWAYNSANGISSTGLDIFGQANFGNINLQGPTGVDGLQYGLTSAGDNLATGNAAVTGGFALIQNSVVFTLSGLSNFNGDLSTLFSGISFQYGTSLTEPNIGAPVPEPATMLLFGSGLVGVFAFGRKRMKG